MDKNSSHIWLSKAKEDLKWTQANLKEKIFYGACFTAQQSAEKTLKAYLLFQGKSLRKIHDLGAIVEECKKFDRSFEKLKEAAATLTDYYLEPRYPDIGEFMEYSQTQAEEALKLAEKIIKFVEKKLG